MKTTTEERPRRETLNLRISAEARNMIDRAAAAKGETRTDCLDAPAQPNERLRKTMQAAQPWK
jgi:uncharacterized protein (DUF1778 family)